MSASDFAIAAISLNKSLENEFAAFEVLANAVAALDSPSLGEVLAAYEVTRSAFAHAVFNAIDLLEAKQ